MMNTLETLVRYSEALFGQGDSDFPFWLLTVRTNILLAGLLLFLTVLFSLTSRSKTQTPLTHAQLRAVASLFFVGVCLRLWLVSSNLLDYGGIPYSRLLQGYRGHFAAAQTYSLYFVATERTLERALQLQRLSSILLLVLSWLVARAWIPERPRTAIFTLALVSASPVMLLFSASDTLALPTGVLALLGTLLTLRALHAQQQATFLPSLQLLTSALLFSLLTQVRYENLLFLAIPFAILYEQRAHLRTQILIPAATTLLAFCGIYLFSAHQAGVSYQRPPSFWSGVETVFRELLLHPLVGLPLLAFGSWLGYQRSERSVRVLFVGLWCCALGLPALTTDSGFHATRVFMSWFPFLALAAARGLDLAWEELLDRRLASFRLAVAVTAWFLLGILLGYPRLTTSYPEIIEHQHFTEQLRALPRGATLIVPDDELFRRQHRSTVETFEKYRKIQQGLRRNDVTLIGLTHFNESNTVPAALYFYAGLPCVQPILNEVPAAQCRAFLQRFSTFAVVSQRSLDTQSFDPCAMRWRQGSACRTPSSLRLLRISGDQGPVP